MRQEIVGRFGVRETSFEDKSASTWVQHKSQLNRLKDYIRSKEFMHFEEAMEEAKAHARNYGLIKSALFELEICEVKVNMKYQDYQTALEMVENLIPRAKTNQKIRKTFELHLLKSEIYIRTSRFKEAVILLQQLFRNSEVHGNPLKARLIYLNCLAKLGILQKAKDRETQVNKENITKHNEGEKTQNSEMCVTKILTDDYFELKSDLKVASKMFLSELMIDEANQCLFLIAKLESSKKVQREKYSGVYMKLKKIQSFCKRNLELLDVENDDGSNFMKFFFKISNIVRTIAGTV
jgi:tetratricopeptide (TPR) repeat protein